MSVDVRQLGVVGWVWWDGLQLAVSLALCGHSGWTRDLLPPHTQQMIGYHKDLALLVEAVAAGHMLRMVQHLSLPLLLWYWEQ
jgi:hypothetical protein